MKDGNLIRDLFEELREWSEEEVYRVADTGGDPWPELIEAIIECTKCPLHESRTRGVPGVGDRNARLMLIGEAPGYHEDQQGEPFVGPAGQLLDRILAAIELDRHQVYITNVIKSRPPNNRTPRAEEIAACRPYLDRQVDLVDPEIICTLGTVATQAVLGTTKSLSKLRGRIHEWKGRLVVPTYHPAALLRNPQLKRPTWEDMKMVKGLYLGELAD